ncbi:MAG TPA: DUF1800 family protein [Opitutaceae bacterium]|nr:DUF1800 family protein [Opitutaceae bacterium]
MSPLLFIRPSGFAGAFHRWLGFAVMVFGAGLISADAADYDQRLANLSTRGQVGTGANVMITGFIIQPGSPKQVLIRAVGPQLAKAPYNVPGTLANPVLSLYNSSNVLIGTNDNWSTADAATMSAVGAFALTPGSTDAAMIVTLSPGTYTAQVSGVSNGTGVALLEVYDVSGSARLMNLSTRALVGSGANTLISGLVVAPSPTARRVLIRAVGPGLASLNVPGAVADPSFTVLNAAGQVIASNDNWGTADTGGILTSTFSSSGAFPLQPGSRDAALIVDLPSNATYTIQVSSVDGSTGVGLVEVYDLTPDNGVLTALPSGNGTLYIAALHPASGAGNSTAYGTATLQLSADEKSALVSVSFSNLSSPETTAHLVIDGVFVQGLPYGQVSGSAWVFQATGSFSAADLVAALKAGRVYLSIDTAGYPGGELTGSLVKSSGSGIFNIPPAPPPIDLAQMSQTDAARFLTQATFGATAADIAALQQKGYAAWLNEQMAMAPSLHRAATLADVGQFTQNATGNATPTGANRQAAWWKIAVTGPDQLRQRVAFALSEILVISDQNSTVNNAQEGAANYYDLLARDAFGNFRQLIEDVTLNPMMGIYLSSLRNAKGTTDSKGNVLTSADENYAREVMQLFTIGLNQLQPDGTLQLDGNGQPIPTYDQTTITETAKVFTGWSYFSSSANPSFRGGASDYIDPMMLFPTQHDDAAKTIVGGKVLPAGQGGAKDLKDTLDTLFNHPNTAPFISRQLIERLVTSNPTPAYVYRVAQVFANNGSGVRGDLGAVVRAILTDYEARSTAYLDVPGHGKLREPLLRATEVLRAFNAASNSGRYNIANPETNLVEASLRATTVFNFFEPSYVMPGDLASAGLYAPEFQILTATTAITIPNFLNTYIYNSRSATDPTQQTIGLDLTSLLPLAKTPSALVDQLNLVLSSGTIPSAMKDRIVAALAAMPGNATDTDRVRTAIYLVVTSPEGAIQK